MLHNYSNIHITYIGFDEIDGEDVWIFVCFRLLFKGEVFQLQVLFKRLLMTGFWSFTNEIGDVSEISNFPPLGNSTIREMSRVLTLCLIAWLPVSEKSATKDALHPIARSGVE